jgi:hypothetical protein
LKTAVDESRVGAGVKVGDGEVAVGVGGDGLREERGGGGAVGRGADGVKLDDGSGDGLLAAVDTTRDVCIIYHSRRYGRGGRTPYEKNREGEKHSKANGDRKTH